MHSSNILAYTILSLASSALVQADLPELDGSDISSACQSICSPAVQLSQLCDVDISDDKAEDLLSLQCYCTNNSFDVSSITSLCQSCMAQYPQDSSDNDNDDLEDINAIVRRCGFSPTSYAASQSTAASDITVSAVRPTAATQLTTTVTGGVGTATPVPTTTGASATATTTVTSNTSDNSTSDAATMGSLSLLLTYALCIAGLGAWL